MEQEKAENTPKCQICTFATDKCKEIGTIVKGILENLIEIGKEKPYKSS